MKKFDEIDLSRANVDILDLFTNNVLDIIFQYIVGGILQYKNFFCIQVPSILSIDFFALEEQGITVTTMSCGNADNAEFVSFMFSSNEEVLPVSHCKEIILDSITSNACSVLSSILLLLYYAWERICSDGNETSDLRCLFITVENLLDEIDRQFEMLKKNSSCSEPYAFSLDFDFGI